LAVSTRLTKLVIESPVLASAFVALSNLAELETLELSLGASSDALLQTSGFAKSSRSTCDPRAP
jgi:hypothetical protein